MVAQRRSQLIPKSVAQLSQTFLRALARRIITHTDEDGIARVITVGDDIVEPIARRQEPVEQMILSQRLVQPHPATMRANQVDGWTDYVSARSGREPVLNYRYRPKGAVTEAAFGSLEFFLIERYRLFAFRGGQLRVCGLG